MLLAKILILLNPKFKIKKRLYRKILSLFVLVDTRTDLICTEQYCQPNLNGEYLKTQIGSGNRMACISAPYRKILKVNGIHIPQHLTFPWRHNEYFTNATSPKLLFRELNND
jgi:hypothetical protein